MPSDLSQYTDEQLLAIAKGGQPTQPVRDLSKYSDTELEKIAGVNQEKKTGTGEAIGRGVLNSALFNFYDELHGLAAAGGAEKPEEGHLGNVILGAYRKLRGNEDAEQAYQAEVARLRESEKQLREEHPGAMLGGEIAGAMAIPVGVAARGASMAARAGLGAATGAGVGALSGAGAGEGLEGTAKSTAIGAGLGGTGGAVAPPVVGALAKGAEVVTRPITNLIRGQVAPEAQAARVVQQAVTEGGGLTPAEIAANPQARIVDVGERARDLARFAANQSPEGSAALNQVIDKRFETQANRFTTWLNNKFGAPDAPAAREALREEARTLNAPAYKRAYDAGEREIYNPALEQLTSAPAVQGAMREAMTNWRNWAVNEGIGSMNPPIAPGQGRLAFVLDPNAGTQVQVTPNLQFWDYTNRVLKGVAAKASEAGDRETAKLYGDFARKIGTQLKREVPEFEAATGGAKGFFDAENALEAGQNFVQKNVDLREAQRALAKFTPKERDLFQKGFVSDFVDKLNKIPDRRTVLNQIAESPEARQKLEIVLGAQGAKELEAMLRVEGIMDLTRAAVQGNSSTARQLAARQWIERAVTGGVGAAGGYGLGGDVQGLTVGALAAALYAGGKSHINQNVARKIAELLASKDFSKLDAGIKSIAKTNKLLEGLRVTDRQIAAQSGEQAGQLGQP